uniref:SWIM-type domain-containing protein n=1 Tax=Rhizophagus irregularis (strain DAOM 181602 / DAOM 197198 / MUCL 43194) TaxID=747089 RepID=U9UYS5_RHIID
MSEIIDLTLDENCFDDKPEDSCLKILYNRQSFTSFEVLEQCLNQYSTQLEFETKIVRAEKEEGVWSRKTYKCRHGGKYEAKKKLDPTQNQDKKSACIKCNFTLNASYRKCPNLVFVNKFIEEHNHVMNINKDLQQFTQSSHKIPDNIIKEIRFYVQECHLGATVLKRILRNKFPNQDIYLIKLEANSGSSLCQLHTGIELRLKDEVKYAKLQEFCNINPLAGLPHVSNTIFKDINDVLLQDSRNVIQQKSNQHDVGFIEDDYEEPQTLLDMALEDCFGSYIDEIWEVKHLQSTTNHSQFIVLLGDGSYYCTCLHLIYAGFVCRHFFAVMFYSKKALFNIKLIPSRWYSKEGLILMNEMQESSICIIQNKEELLSTETFQALKNIRGQNVYASPVKNSKKAFYGHRFGLCKKVINLAIINNSGEIFEDLLQRFIE